ncbi:MAG: Gfo/Idh/MocA family oxidoreductase [Paludibacter sp.]|nr:Gfo/Idh/MocA family oxidoreductase [Paludibacter sp.]
MKLVIAGMSHGHIVFILNREPKKDFILAGVYEPNKELALSLSKKFGFSKDLIYDNMEKMFDKVKPEAVVAFGSVYDHLKVIEAAAPRGIHVMVEKPLATTVAQAERMKYLANKHNIKLLTDYETSWYPSIASAFNMIREQKYVGNIKKIIVNAGHQGPKEIGCDPYFLEWLTDPKKNGAGALFDFGCYGANLATAIMKNHEPLSVTAITRQYKPQNYPLVDDDATIIINYPGTNCIIQASWNWTFNRKDIEIYGDSGYIIAADNYNMRMKNNRNTPEKHIITNAAESGVYEDPFSYFHDVICGVISPSPYSLYSLENNVLTVKILEAALKSAREQKTVVFPNNLQ